MILPKRDGAFVEIHIEKEDLEHAARLGASAVLTAIFEEGTDAEKIVKIPLSFANTPTRRFSVSGGEVREVQP